MSIKQQPEFRRPRLPPAADVDVERYIETGEAIPRSPAAQPNRSAYPWDDSSPKSRQNVMFKLPEPEYLMLKWLAQTTYGASQNGLALGALRKEIKILMAERGIAVEEGADGVLHVVGTGV